MDINPPEYAFDCAARLGKKVEGRFGVTRNNQIHFVSAGDPIVIHIAKIEGNYRFLCNLVSRIIAHFQTKFRVGKIRKICHNTQK